MQDQALKKIAAYWDWSAGAAVPDARIVVCAPGLYDTIAGCKVASTGVLMAASARGVRFVITATDWAPWKDGASLSTLIPAIHVTRQADLEGRVCEACDGSGVHATRKTSVWCPKCSGMNTVGGLPALLAARSERRALVVSPEEAVDLDPLVCEEHGEAEIVYGDDGATPFCGECPSGEEATEMGSAGYLDGIDVVFIVGLDKPLHPDWVRSIVAQCRAAGVPCVFVTWGEHVTLEQMPPGTSFDLFASCGSGIAGDETSWYRVGPERSGALLDGAPVRDVPAWLGGDRV